MAESKSRLLYILKYLWQNTDAEHYATTADILAFLKGNGISCDRKTIPGDIAKLCDINRLDYGKKYCHNSPSIEESVLQEAIMKAVLQTARQNAEVLKTLKLHIGMGLSADATEDNSLDLQIKIAEIEAEFQKMLKAIAADNVEAFDEEKAKALMDEKAKLQLQLDRIADTKQKRENAKSRLDEIFVILEALANHPISYDDQIVRQILESVIVESKDRIKVVFVGGLGVTQSL